MLMRTGGAASLTYGQETMGVSPTTLLAQRRAVAAALVASGTADLDMALVLADGSAKGRADPAFAAHDAPIGYWALAVWGDQTRLGLQRRRSPLSFITS